MRWTSIRTCATGDDKGHIYRAHIYAAPIPHPYTSTPAGSQVRHKRIELKGGVEVAACIFLPCRRTDSGPDSGSGMGAWPQSAPAGHPGGQTRRGGVGGGEGRRHRQVRPAAAAATRPQLVADAVQHHLLVREVPRRHLQRLAQRQLVQRDGAVRRHGRHGLRSESESVTWWNSATSVGGPRPRNSVARTTPPRHVRVCGAMCGCVAPCAGVWRHAGAPSPSLPP
jgi:hypothetical protein